MSGELWRGTVQFGVENPVAYGTPVPATRRMYFTDPTMARTREPRLHRFATTTRDNVRNITLGPTVVAGTLVQPLSAEVIELLEIGIKGAVTPTANVWTFTPDPVLGSATVEWHDGAVAWQAAGCYVNTLRFAGSVSGENLVTAEIFGKAMIQNALTGSLTHSTPAVFEGWETALYVDDFEDAPGVSGISGTLINWDVLISNNLGRKYFADNTIDLGGVAVGVLDVEATLTFEAASADAAAEFALWEAGTKRLVRLEFGNNTLIGGGPLKETISLDIPGAWTAFDLGGTDEGTRTYELKLSYVFDPTNLWGFQALVTTARTVAWADRPS